MFSFDDKITNLLRVYSLTRLEYIRGVSGELTYNKAKHIIAKYFKCQFTKPSEYIAAIQKYNLELPTDPELYFIDFISWDDYLGTETGNGYYTRGEIFDAMRRSLRAGVIGRFMDIDSIIKTLYESDARYPEPLMWLGMYGISKKSDLKPVFKN
jgi:hypothetical protein